MTWLEELMDCTKELESPRSFWYWSGLATISAILKDSVWISRGGAFDFYPNIYVMLLAGSALKKGLPIGISKRIVKEVNNTKLIIGRSSIQGIMKKLSSAQTSPGGKINTKSCGFIVASEFSSSLVEDPAAFNLLTDLYDRQFNPGDYESLLKSEVFQLRDPTLSMLIATNDPHLKEFVKTKDIYGGFFGRMFVIREEHVSRLNSLVDDLVNPPDPIKLAGYLKELAKLQGPFKSLSGTPQGKKYNLWYTDFYKTVEKQKIEDNTGTIGRFGDSVLKVAMLLSLSEKPELEITEKAMDEAIEVCEKLITGVRKATMGHEGRAQFVEQKSIIIAELLEREDHRISRTQLMKKYWMQFNSDELDIIMRSFDDAGMIHPHQYGGTLVYEMPESVVEDMIARMRGKK